MRIQIIENECKDKIILSMWNCECNKIWKFQAQQQLEGFILDGDFTMEQENASIAMLVVVRILFDRVVTQHPVFIQHCMECSLLSCLFLHNNKASLDILFEPTHCTFFFFHFFIISIEMIILPLLFISTMKEYNQQRGLCIFAIDHRMNRREGELSTPFRHQTMYLLVSTYYKRKIKNPWTLLPFYKHKLTIIVCALIGISIYYYIHLISCNTINQWLRLIIIKHTLKSNKCCCCHHY